MNYKLSSSLRLIILFFIIRVSLGLPIRASYSGVLLQLRHDPDKHSQFPWSWSFIKQHINQIKAAGYTAILVSPHQQSCGISIGYNLTWSIGTNE